MAAQFKLKHRKQQEFFFTVTSEKHDKGQIIEMLRKGEAWVQGNTIWTSKHPKGRQSDDWDEIGYIIERDTMGPVEIWNP